jgi:pimeloyl-ACP methyl ester carboxylesterase
MTDREERPVPQVTANGVELEYETFGAAGDPALVLVMGLGAQLIDWPLDFCEALAAHGFHVIRFDNRDIGLSASLDSLGVPDVRAVMAGDTGAAPYLLADFAADTVGLLDALGIAKAHVVGASMGGMIAQQVAIDHQDRVLSICSIMSTTGDPAVARGKPEALAVLGAPPASSRAEAIRNAVAASRVIGSTGFTVTDEELLQRATAKYDRSYRPLGVLRQYAAIVASPDRTADLRGVKVPAVVIHGEVDPLVPVSGGQATAAAIPGAELVVIPGMGHDLPVGARPRVIEAIVGNARRAVLPDEAASPASSVPGTARPAGMA